MTNTIERVGTELARGRYKILDRIGAGNMGQVYRAQDRHLGIDVVIKFPETSDATLPGAEFLARFEREVRALLRLSHPHIVKVIDVGEVDRHPYIVMEYLAGGSLKDRLDSGPRGAQRPMPAESLHDWLLDVARALDFIHAQKHVHRDVKPANILFDRHGNAYLGDFGIIKALANESSDPNASAATAPGFLLATPNFVAPEVVMGRVVDGRADQYSLALTAHEVLTGSNVMSGPSPSATMVNQTTLVPPALDWLIPGISPRLSAAIARALAKDPAERFPNCVAFAQEALADLPQPDASTAEVARLLPCPDCGNMIPVAIENVGERVMCQRCQSSARVELSSNSALWLRPIDATTGTDVDPKVLTLYGPGGPAGRSDETIPTLAPYPSTTPRSRSGRRRALVGIGSAVVVLALALGWARWGRPARQLPAAGSGPVTINIAVSTKKEKWLNAALKEFQRTPEGQRIKVKLVRVGSDEGGQAVVDGPNPIPIHVWAPTSTTDRDNFERAWKAKHRGAPILRAESLTRTPMVFVLWKDRYDAFLKKYGKVNFATLAEAQRAPEGWTSIAGRSEWGRFKFSHTHPYKSNSGLLTLVLMAYELARKDRGLTLADVAQTRFQEWLKTFELDVVKLDGALSNGNGPLMKAMVESGPKAFDALMIYESAMLEDMKEASAAWQPLQVVYPLANLWNERPYYILDVPWSDPAQRAAAQTFLDFLLSAAIQSTAVSHGLRPVNRTVPVGSPDSLFVLHKDGGVMTELPPAAELPAAEVIEKLRASFLLIENGRGTSPD